MKKNLCGDSKVMLSGSPTGMIIQNSSILLPKAGKWKTLFGVLLRGMVNWSILLKVYHPWGLLILNNFSRHMRDPQEMVSCFTFFRFSRKIIAA